MASWRPYQDQHNSAYVSILTSLFPEQTKTIPRIIVWSIIFLLDLTVGIVGGQYLGLMATRLGSVAVMVAIFGGFWLQGKIFYGIAKLFR